MLALIPLKSLKPLFKPPLVLFVTGTDTGIGKTTVICHWIRTLSAQGYRVAGMKPLASGCEWVEGCLRNSDALLIQEAMRSGSCMWPYERINPVPLARPIAPHLAAAEQNIHLSVDRLLTDCFRSTDNQDFDVLLIEGIGGWYVPLNQSETMADLVRTWHIPVCLVVGLRLGCLSHALLTARAIQHDQVVCLGYVANELCLRQPEDFIQQNKETLDACLGLICLGHIPFQS